MDEKIQNYIKTLLEKYPDRFVYQSNSYHLDPSLTSEQESQLNENPS
jgi:hypothetical protein